MKAIDLRKRIYLDGGFGSLLMARGIEASPDVALKFPDEVRRIHREYLEAGAGIVSAATFSANRLKTQDYARIIPAALELAKIEAKKFGARVAYDCGPTGALLEPFGELSFEEAYSIFCEQAKIINGLDVDFVLLETFTDLAELKAAFLAFSENTSYPIWCSMAFLEDGRTFSGTRAAAFAVAAEAWGAGAVGVNCGGGPSALFNAVKEITLHTNLPVFAQPNAGMPRYENGKTVYDLSPDEFAASMAELADSGLFALGGCCGTTPEYIKKLIKATEKFEVKKFRYDKPAVCSSSAVVELKAGTVVGERVNPTGKPRLKQALISGDDDFVLNLCLEQTAAGAGILDINVGAAGIDEKAALVAVVKKVQGLTPAPLQIDTSRAEALCAAVRMVAGVPIINSVTAEEKSLNAVLPVAKKYGCYVICLPLDENGIPQTAEGRLELAEKIVEAAENCGVSRGKLIFDGLTMAQSVSGDNAKITLDTVAEFSKRGFMTCLGLSNISFGLPARELINATFYALALKRGLTLAIVNPAVKPEINLDALAVLGNEDENAANFIAKHAGETKPREALAEESSISGAIIKGLKREGAAIAKARANAENALSIIENEIIPALKTLGELYDQKRVFLPQLIAGSEAAKAVLDIVKPLMPASDRKLGVPMLILTVKGDVHDIGKNIVKAVLENYGFEIKDLGKSVDYPIVLEELARTDAKVVGLSALMTTTLDNMSETILKIRESYPDVVIIVGGAVVSEAYAKERGVLYAKDAGEAARVLSKIFADN